MTGSNASYQQLGLGVDAMMSTCCFVSGDGSSFISADTASLFYNHHVPEYTPHGGSSFGFGHGEPPSDVAAPSSFLADGSVLLAGQLLRATALEEETHGAYGDVTVAHHAPRMMMANKHQLLAGEPHGHGGGWIHEPSSYYYCPTTAWLTGGVAAFRDDPFAGPLRLRAAGSSPTAAAGAVSVSVMSLPPDQSSEVSSSAGPGGLFQQPLCAGAGTGQVVARPAGPVHFSQVLSRWPGYADITQQALDEFVSCLLQDVPGFAGGLACDAGESASHRLPSPSCSNSKTTPSVFAVGGSEEEEKHNNHNKLLKNHLQKLLQLMDQRCKECVDEIQSAASKYGSLVRPASGGGALSAPFAHSAVSAMHQRLRARITGEIAAAGTRRRGGRDDQPSSSSLADRERSWESAFIQKHWALRQLRRGDQQSWRPQRGLPEKSVAVLKAWMFENFLRPYPKDNEKEMLAARSGLSRSQVSNWFINARVRLWKPMIEEMYEDLKKASGGMEGA